MIRYFTTAIARSAAPPSVIARSAATKQSSFKWLLAAIFLLHTSLALAAQSAPEAKDVKQLAVDAVLAVYDYNYKNYDAHFAHAEKFFTTKGWDSFKDALEQSKNLDLVKQHQLTVQAKILAPAKVVAQNLESGLTVWKVEVPIEVTYTDPKAKVIKQTLDAHVVIHQDPQTQALGVAQLILGPRAKPDPAAAIQIKY